jgi:ATP/maltotriose-dependent transcriptional regulator MalT
MGTEDLLERGRDAYQRLAWGDAYAQLAAADQQAPLGADDLERLAVVAYLTGREEDAVAALERAHQALLDDAEVARAVRCAFWLGIMLLQGGQHAQGGGWLARARRELDDAGLDCVEQGYLVVPPALQALMAGDGETSLAGFRRAAEVAERFGDPDLVAMSRLGQGQALVELGEAARGVSMLDEAMVVATSGEVSPILAAIVYCGVIVACQKVFDLRRAQEWTLALSRWCEAQQDLQPYRGQCLVHRAEILQLRGDWQAAMAEVQQACSHLSKAPGDPVMGMAQYQLAELHRLRGAFAKAEEGYRQASQWGHPVQPGLALLRLVQGRTADAEAAIRRVVQEQQDRVPRSRVLAAYVEIMLAVGEVEVARDAAEELAAIAEDFASPFLRAITAYARGAVLLAEGEAAACCVVLREAAAAWQDLDAPYEVARAQLLMARACQRLGDRDTAGMELAAARRTFEQLAAVPALAQVKALTGRVAPQAPGGLTSREMEVLALVAKGRTNRQISDELVISEKTVARHVSNIFSKLGVASRSAATAYAYEHDLV